MDQQSPPEAEDLELLNGEPPEIAVVERVNDASARLLRDFRVDRDELEVLARYYLEDVRNWEYWRVAHGVIGGTKKMWFAECRLGDIGRILGEDVLHKALARVEEEWRRSFDEARDLLATRVKCEQCGAEFYREWVLQDACMGCLPTS